MKSKIIIFFLSLSLILSSFFTVPAYAAVSSSRIYGQNRYETSSKIAECYNSSTLNNVVLVYGEDFPDALSASVLAHKLNAPILLVDPASDGSSNAFDYIVKHLDKSGNVYIIGSAASANDNFTSYLNQMGYKNIIEIGNNDRYYTNYMVARELDVPQNTPVVISSGENYPDALGISSFAAHNNWPILLVPNNTIPDKTVEFLLSDKPSKVYITGGTGVITSNVEEQIQGLLPDSEIIRFAGKDRFDTNAQIIQAFATKTRNLFLASGYGFADALSGSVLAALDGEPIVLVDPAANTIPAGAAQLLTNFKGIFQNVVSFGGTAVVPESAAENAINIISGKSTDNTSSDNLEKRIKDALINKTTCLFKISGEYTFMPGVEGLKTFSDEKGTTKYKQTAEWAQDDIKGSSSGFIIRIDEGIATMEDSTNYTCSLKINGNDEGVSLSIDHVKSSTYAVHINGTIKGNTLTASEQVSTAYYSPYTKSGFGTSSSGQYSVGLVNIPEEQWPPMPVTLSYSINSDKSVTLTWKDKNPSTLIGYYEIYREVDVAKEYTKIATVSNCTTWTDSSKEVSDSFRFSLSYIVIAYSKTGVKSPDSNYVLYFPSNW